MINNYQRIYNKLLDYYGPQHWWPADTPFEMMIGAILVQNTSWHNAEKALMNVEPYLDPERMEELRTDELAQLIRSSGFFNIKAKRIKAFLDWFKAYHYNIPTIKKLGKQTVRNELLTINGIGRETADVMLLYAFDKPVFVVDAYARRIFYRIGLNMPTSYDTFQKQVEDAVPSDLQVLNDYHALLVEHAKVHCKATPICEGCPLFEMCEQRLG
ncbi:endonuclease III domain-containing protein [Lentibacillus sp. CBA3610]|uniref:endonuclease III domain-containing protein n=1 Tax=Lentibacillus sp. CBA3610 TaxID=2518176 RepID=UPI001595073F|nr:endonuclease III domain-containing protein [Lentibacillus sp. CBA3610]QKY71025.1 endonuclease III domain-containing protein [Lentibacillus sp. CBA3610]